MGIRLAPRKAKTQSNYTKDAWWYEEKNAISVFIQRVDGHVASAIISKRAIQSWLKRLEKKP